MAEDEKAEENLIEAMQRVVKLPWPSIRDRILWNALTSLCRYFKLEIVTDKPGGHQPISGDGPGNATPPNVDSGGRKPTDG